MGSSIILYIIVNGYNFDHACGKDWKTTQCCINDNPGNILLYTIDGTLREMNRPVMNYFDQNGSCIFK